MKKTNKLRIIAGLKATIMLAAIATGIPVVMTGTFILITLAYMLVRSIRGHQLRGFVKWNNGDELDFSCFFNIIAAFGVMASVAAPWVTAAVLAYTYINHAIIPIPEDRLTLTEPELKYLNKYDITPDNIVLSAVDRKPGYTVFGILVNTKI